jgi:uncharacterized membrane protein
MRREEFLDQLDRQLRDLPSQKRAEILGDYTSYFEEGAAAGRDDRDIAESLGNPARLAIELRLGHDLQSLGTSGGPHAAIRALGLLLRLVAVDGAAWLLLAGSSLLVLLLIVAGVVTFFYGGFILVTEPFDAPLGGYLAASLRALAFLAAGVALGIISLAGVHALAALFLRLRRRARGVVITSTEVIP